MLKLNADQVSGVPYVTLGAILAALLLFAGLAIIAHRSPNYLGDTVVDSDVDPAIKFRDVEARNRAAVYGLDPGSSMSVGESASRLSTVAHLVKNDISSRGRLPYPVVPIIIPVKDKK